VIFGVGVDMVEIERVRLAIGRHGERFAGRILAECEWPDYRQARNPVAFLAKCFAAKEALGKATGLGIRTPVTLRAMWLHRSPLGQPAFGFSPVLSDWLRSRGIARSHVSIADERSAVIAFVVLESGSVA